MLQTLLQASIPLGADLLSKLADNMLTLGVLGFFAWAMWKRDERYRNKLERKMEEMEKRMQDYQDNDRKALLTQLQRSNDVMDQSAAILHETNLTLKNTNRIMDCYSKEMLEFKNSELYRQYLAAKKQSA